MSDSALKIVGTEDNNTIVQSLSVPHNTEIEAALLSALILDNRKCELIAETLKTEHFYAPYNARIYQIITEMVDRLQVVTASTLKHIFESDPMLKEGGLDYLAELVTNASPLLGSSTSYYAATIRDFYQKRELISLGEHVVNSAYDLSDLDNTATRQIESAEEQLYNLAEHGDSIRSTISLKEALVSAIEATSKALSSGGNFVGVTSGFVDLDNLLGGLHPSDLLILAGRPAMGKTALATNIAFNAARSFAEKLDRNGKPMIEGARVLFFSLEMSADQLGMRILAEQSGVKSNKMRSGTINQKDLENISEVSMQISQVPLYIDDTPALSVSSLRQRARRWKRSKGVDLIVIDYLQLLQASQNRRYDNRVMEISEITRSLKSIAKELNVPILALSQLSRQVEQREDKIPQLSDLRESGTIEQDSDVVMFIYREEYYLRAPTQKEGMSKDKFQDLEQEYSERLEGVRNKTQIIVAKQRHGPVGTVDLHFDAEFTRFSNSARENNYGE